VVFSDSFEVSSSRFLIKHLKPVEADGKSENKHNSSTSSNKIVSLEYKWLYMAFHVLWIRSDSSASPTLVLLCFDLVEEAGQRFAGNLESEIRSQLAQDVAAYTHLSPFAIHASLLRVVIPLCDEPVWDFRDPLRDLEMVRDNCVFLD